MYRKVLIPLDGSRFSERILAHVRPLLTANQTKVVLLRVVGPYGLGVYPDLSVLASAAMRRKREEAHAYLRGLQGELRELGIEARVNVREGDVPSLLCSVAEAEGIDLIAMTTHGRAGVSRWALGSVADHVVRITRQPLLLVRAATEVPPTGRLRRILVPLDGSELAEWALLPAQILATEHEASLLLLRSADLKTERELDGILRTVVGGELLLAQRARAAEHYLSHIEKRLEPARLTIARHIVHSQPADGILATAAREQVDLIVMSTHARSALGRWVYGSVADRVLRGAPCPLLLVRAPDQNGQVGDSPGPFYNGL